MSTRECFSHFLQFLQMWDFDRYVILMDGEPCAGLRGEGYEDDLVVVILDWGGYNMAARFKQTDAEQHGGLERLRLEFSRAQQHLDDPSFWQTQWSVFERMAVDFFK